MSALARIGVEESLSKPQQKWLLALKSIGSARHGEPPEIPSRL